jgi:hypothetical protein
MSHRGFELQRGPGQHEAGEGQSHAPWALPLTRLARWRSSHRPLAKSPMQAVGDVTLPDIPHDARVSQNNGKKVPELNFPLPNDIAHISHGGAAVSICSDVTAGKAWPKDHGRKQKHQPN